MKTVEEAANNISYSQCKIGHKNPQCNVTDSKLCPTCSVGNPVYLGCLKMATFVQRWILVEEELPEIELGEAYSERFLLKCKIFKSTKIFLCVRSTYGEFVVEGMNSKILDPHYKPIEWRPIELK